MLQGSVSSALRWWEEWQMRVLVLGSLFFHLFLYLSPPPRNRRNFRAVVWIAYIGGDAVAIYALATLFNRNRQTATGLEVIWAPILLIHLAGHPSISAFSLEDNELWRRQAITLVSQVTVALYVFFRWWSGERRMLQAAVLLFVVGIIKFCEKPWGLRRASFSNMLATAGVSPLGSSKYCCTIFLCDLVSQMSQEEEEAEAEAAAAGGGIISLEEYVEKANKYVHEVVAIAASDKLLHTNVISTMLVDMPTPYSDRLSRLQSFLKLEEEQAHGTLVSHLDFMHSLLYTRGKATLTLLGSCLRYFVYPTLLSASLVLFAKSHKDGYTDEDVWVTYILICCTGMADFFFFWYCISFCVSFCIGFCIGFWSQFHVASCEGVSQQGFCPGVSLQGSFDFRVPQYSLMAKCVRKKKPSSSSFVMKLATLSCIREYVDKYWYVEREPAASFQITRLVQQHVRDGWKEYIVDDAARYRRFSELRGQRSLRRHRRLLGWSLNMPFDKTVLVWHIATDLCFHQQQHPAPAPADDDTTTPDLQQVGDDSMQRSREISNYMIYLLFIRPEMLMPGTRQGLFTDAADDIELILKDSKAQLHSQQVLAREIMNTLSSSSDDDVESLATGSANDDGPVHAAYRLAKGLMELYDDEEERWTVIQGVWVEMLCYSASRCRGFLHAKNLGEGYEYLSTVWLLWWYMGMETLGDRYQMSQPSQEEEEENSTSHSIPT